MKRPPSLGVGVDVSVDRLHFDLHLSGTIGFAKVTTAKHCCVQTIESKCHRGRRMAERHWVAMMRALSPFFNACPSPLRSIPSVSSVRATATHACLSLSLPFARPAVACATVVCCLRIYAPTGLSHAHCTHADTAGHARSNPSTRSLGSQTHTPIHMDAQSELAPAVVE